MKVGYFDNIAAMSSFKRNIPSGVKNLAENKSASVARAPSSIALPKGTKLSPHHTQLLLTSTGISSLDGVIGGGLPVGTLGLVVTDQCTSYARTALSYYISQGIMHQHQTAVISASEELDVTGGSLKWLDSLPGPYKVSSGSSEKPVKKPEDSTSSDDSLTIAWRYKNLPKINSGPQIQGSAGIAPYCHTFDLTSPLSAEIRKDSPVQVVLLNQEDSDGYYSSALEKIKGIIDEGGHNARSSAPVSLSQRRTLRIAIHALGSPFWPAGFYRFLHGLKNLLRHSFATAMVTFPAHLHTQTQCRAVFNVADLVMEFRSFADSPDAQPSEYHGLFYLHKTPQVNSLMSMGLRTVSSPAPSRTAAGGSTTTNAVTNDLGFKLKRKKLVIETFHLPIEGGVSDRRTEPPKDLSEPRRFTAPNRPVPAKSSPIDF